MISASASPRLPFGRQGNPFRCYAEHEAVADAAGDYVRCLAREYAAAVASAYYSAPEAQVDCGEVVEAEEVARPRSAHKSLMVAEVYLIVKLAVFRREENAVNGISAM